ncbi:hypothetical protein CRE_02864 [Caenorhabditis remanei]|uniref:Uncharacterized protein n=1 Tax=Caenorhabditis remanei TaxID=31234 RepID=E3LWB4_CAERE|nr:hypothetical protein CRE_02864 [Caenorhabditis remanei]
MNNFQPNNTSATFALSSAAKMMMPDYEMYKIHRQGQQLNSANGSDHQKKLTKKNTFQKSKGVLEDDDEDEKTKCKVATIRIEDHDEEEEKRKMERKKRTQEDMVADFVKILEQMMNPRQAVTSIISAGMGVAAITVAVIFFGSLPESALNAKQLVIILAVYGILQIVLATAFFITCMQTTIAVSKGVKDAFQIVVGLLVALIYVAVTLISLAVGVFGFYKTLCIVSFVEYEDLESQFYCPPPVFYTSLTVFILHIVLIVAKCCCCK